MVEKSYTIGEIAQLFQIPTSTIRYWEEKEIFSVKRNQGNEYREYTLQEIFELLDVIFYRNLNIPIKKMKHFNRLSPDEIYTLLDDTEKMVQQELQELEKKSIGIARRKKQLESFATLKTIGYKIEELLPIQKIVPFDMTNAEDMQIQLQQLSNFVLYKENAQESAFQMGLVVSEDYQRETIWQLDRLKEATYITCLLTCDTEDFELNNFAEHVEAMKKKGYTIKRVIAPYLVTTFNHLQEPVDYYKAWLEVETIKK